MASEHTYFSQRTPRCRWQSAVHRGLVMAGLACSLLIGSLSHADTVGYWRFGDDPNGFLADSGGNNLHLRQLDPNDVATIPNFDPNPIVRRTQPRKRSPAAALARRLTTQSPAIRSWPITPH